ncbi:MAG: muconolactone Delta-isomerase family protein [Bacteroidota bacterium]|jgi:muconolactone delta-isomerase
MENNGPLQYMVDFTLPSELSEDFIQKIPSQRNLVNRLIGEGKVLNYSLSLQDSKLWVVFCADTEAELLDMVYQLPLTRYMSVRISALSLYSSSRVNLPAFSVN